MDLQLTGKVAVVTGGSAGIGLAIARGLAAEGAHVALCARDEGRLRSAAAQIEAAQIEAAQTQAAPTQAAPTQAGQAAAQTQPGQTQARQAQAGHAQAGQTQAGHAQAGQAQAGHAQAGQTQAGQTQPGQTQPAPTQAAPAGGVRVLAIPADLTVPGESERVAEAVAAEFGGADILINNAGTGSEEKILTAPDERWQHYWDLHVMAAVRLARALAPGMKARGGGVILHNASICATQPLGYEPIYNVTKAALVMFSKCLANELIGDNIRVNAVNPGLVMTGDWIKTAKLLTEGTDQTWEAYLQKIADDNAPIGRFATPEEVADFFVFLCSSRASYSVGSSYYVDGGWLNVTT